MSLVLAVNANNDLFIGPDGSLALARNLEAVEQAAQQAAASQLGEMVLAVDRGVPNFAVTWNGAPRLGQFEAYLRRAIMAVDGVLEVQELRTSRAGNVLSYRATIRTIYGQGVLNG